MADPARRRRRETGRYLAYLILVVAGIGSASGDTPAVTAALIALACFTLAVQILREVRQPELRRAEPERPALPPGVPPASYARLNIRMRLRDVPAFVRVPYVLIQSEGATRPDYEYVEILSWHVEHDEKEKTL